MSGYLTDYMDMKRELSKMHRAKILNYACRLGLILLLALSGAVFADTEQDLKAYIKDSTELLIAKLEQERETYYSDHEHFYTVMDEALDEVVDFRRIAARVMGRYRREATDTQKDAFVEVFKKSLFNAYGKTLVESGDFSIQVLGADISPRDQERATVDLEISTSTGSKFPVVYAMYKNTDDQKWYLENVIVNGVNIGLAFRDRFEQQYAQFNGDLNLVVTNWSSQLEDEKLKVQE